MKIKRLYLLGIGLMFTSQFLTSCHDLLEKDPTDSYSETVAWSSESSLDMYVTYLYKPLNGLSNFSSLSLTDGYTDLVKYGNGVPQTWSAHNKILLQQNTITSDNNPMSSWGLYTDILEKMYSYVMPVFMAVSLVKIFSISVLLRFVLFGL